MILWNPSKSFAVLKGRTARPPVRRPPRQLLLECLESRSLLSGLDLPQLLSDVNPGIEGSSPRGFLGLGETAYFVAHETELWKTDGTELGTSCVADTGPSSDAGASIGELIDVNGKVVFSRVDYGALVGDSSDDRVTLWTSDGTSSGTVVVKDFGLGSWLGTSAGADFIAAAGAVFGAVGTPDCGVELWKSNLDPSDPNGAVMVKDIYPGPEGSHPGDLLSFNGKLFFTALDEGERELWESDGTPVGTVKWDLKPGSWTDGTPRSSYPRGLVVWASLFYFAAFEAGPDNVDGTDDDSGQLWKSDGTLAGTELVKDFGPGSSAWGPQLTPVNGRMFGVFQTPEAGTELWSSDGTPSGTMLVKDVNSGPDGSWPYALTNVNGTLFFVANDGVHGSELWKTDGTSSGTVLVRDIASGSNGGGGPASSDLDHLTSHNGLLYFTAKEGTYGEEMWRSDGTLAGTIPVTDAIRPGSDGSSPEHLKSTGLGLFFSAEDGRIGHEPWLLKPQPFELLKDISPAESNSHPGEFLAIAGTTFFSANGTELWKTDGTAGGTSLVVNTGPASGSGGAYLGSFLDVNGVLAFLRVDRGATGDPTETEDDRVWLWKSNGTSAGTIVAKDFGPGSWVSPSAGARLINIGGTVFGAVGTAQYGHELWKSNLNPADPVGTILVKDINPGSDDSYIEELQTFNGKLYFSAWDGIDTELWQSDGTAAGTVKWDLKPGIWADGTPRSSYVRELTPWGPNFFFGAWDAGPDNDFWDFGDNTVQLWKSNGTFAGTVLVKDFGPGSATWDLQLTLAGTLLFAAVPTAAAGRELWKSDGTESGTVLVKDIVPGPAGSAPSHLTNAEGTLFFTADDGIHGMELWKSDGSAAGTTLVKEFVFGSSSSYPHEFQNVHGVVYFAADAEDRGQALWRSDGTAVGTQMVAEINPSEGGDNLSGLVYANGRLFFSAYHPAYGQEPWVLTVQTTGWHNSAFPWDVDNDGAVTAADVLAVVNYLNSDPGQTFPPSPSGPPPYYDVNNDGLCSPIDVLVVINYINVHGTGAGEGEVDVAPRDAAFPPLRSPFSPEYRGGALVLGPYLAAAPGSVVGPLQQSVGPLRVPAVCRIIRRLESASGDEHAKGKPRHLAGGEMARFLDALFAEFDAVWE